MSSMCAGIEFISFSKWDCSGLLPGHGRCMMRLSVNLLHLLSNQIGDPKNRFAQDYEESARILAAPAGGRGGYLASPAGTGRASACHRTPRDSFCTSYGLRVWRPYPAVFTPPFQPGSLSDKPDAAWQPAPPDVPFRSSRDQAGLTCVLDASASTIRGAAERRRGARQPLVVPAIPTQLFPNLARAGAIAPHVAPACAPHGAPVQARRV